MASDSFLVGLKTYSIGGNSIAVFSILILTSTDRYSSHPSSKKLHFAANGEHCRKTKLVKIQKTTDHGMPRSQLIT